MGAGNGNKIDPLDLQELLQRKQTKPTCSDGADVRSVHGLRRE
jgi:hypothetical protein